MTSDGLEALGWSEMWASAFEPDRAQGLVAGRVTLEHNHVLRVQTAEGERLAESAGRLKHRASGSEALPVVGDWVSLAPGAVDSRWIIRRILPRRTTIERKAAGRRSRRQVLVANVDVAFVVAGLDTPINRRRLERYIVVARQPDLLPVVVLNKMDLCADQAGALSEARLAAGESPVEMVSVHSGQGLENIRRLLSSGRTAVLLGPSGVGKSSLANALAGESILRTGLVRPSDARGRHVSVHRQLIVLPGGGCIIDTPGLREVQPWEDARPMEDAFDDIMALADACRFRDCRHDREPGCAVKAAVDTGALDPVRYAHFVKLHLEREALAVRLEEARRTEGSTAPARPGRSPRTRVRR